MKRILLFLLLFCFFGSIVFAAESDDLPKLVVAPFINFDQIFVSLKQILFQIFYQYYQLILGIVVVILLLSYFQSILEDRRMREGRERRELEYRRNFRERSEMSREEKRLLKERDLICRYAQVDKDQSLRIQNEMYRSSQESEEELGLAPIDDEVPGNNIDRGGTFWRPDGSEEGSDPFFEDTATISESSTVIIPDHKRRQDRFYRSMENDDDGGGY
ncbi:MAG: hypothetical protein LBE12_21115 [Planctomycetaceae bacterium]|nr:hypothetical protein [Planctomycetaceae bacterium]